MIKDSIPLRSFPTLLIILLFSPCLFQLVVSGSNYIALEDSYTIKKCIAKERDALLIFKQGLVDEYGVLSSWGSEEDKKDCCRWIGIQCSNRTGRVTKLDLSKQFLENAAELEGELSPSLLELHDLTYLNLSQQYIGNYEPIPKFVGSLVQLQYLDLHQCSFSGIIPYQLGNLSKLRYLDIGGSYSDADDNLINSLSHLTSLTDLVMSCVDLSKATRLFNTITSLPSLSFVDLGYCQLTSSSFPHFSVNSTTSISTLLLDENDLHGPIPDILSNMSMLSHLSLIFSKLQGVIPKSFGNLCNLQILSLSHNNFSENPSVFLENFYGCVESSLQSIDLSRNNFTGPIPYTLGNKTSLTYLDLSKNRLQGVIPKSFRNLCNLQTLKMPYNNFNENLPEFWANIYGCAEGSLQSISLSGNHFNGLMLDITRLPSLVELSLSKNKITGPLPNFTGCSSLERLYISRNEINGSLPESLGQLYMLQVLDVSFNSLEGIVSEVHLFNLSSLKNLDMSFNNVTIEFMEGWVPPFQLDTIKLRACLLGPRFPRWIRTQKNISYLDISHSGIADTIPMWFWNQSTSRLKYFSASSNNITGVLPNLSSSFSQYPVINLGFNLLEGPIPLFPSNSTSINLSHNNFSGQMMFLCSVSGLDLSFLDLSNNQLSGQIPDPCLKNMTNLVILDLSHNKLSGKIPGSIGDLSALEIIDFENNSLSEALPLSLKNCTMLTFLNLGGNKLSGIIPSWVGERFTNLYILIMRSNQFTGTIPLHICHLVNLQLLDLSANNLSGRIPQCFKNFTAMVQKTATFDISMQQYMITEKTIKGILGGTYVPDYYNESALIQWKGAKREFDKGIGLLKSIDLSQNELIGELPASIINLVEMVALNISQNKLHGVLPLGIGELTSLESLDLSRNMFSGAIPPSMVALHFLSYLDLAYNNFSGRIPSGTQLQSFDASQYMGNDELCGPPLTPKCPGDVEETRPPSPTIIDTDSDELDKWFDIGLAVGMSCSFWPAVGALLLYRPWRHAYFCLLGKFKDWIYVMVAIRLARGRGSRADG